LEAYWNVGRLIVEKQGGKERADYGDGLIEELSKRLTKEYGKGFDKTNLSRMRLFHILFPICDALRQQLTWTHYRLLMRVENQNARNYYLEECSKSHWSTRQLERQINSFFYERILSSKTEKSKKAVATEIYTKELDMSPLDFIKDPYVLEFTGLKQDEHLYENELEKALLTHLQKFLLELGRGFTFESRQKRISFDENHFYIDLVFYNYILKCFVLIDLKIGKLTTNDTGQMTTYINYYTQEMMLEGDNPPIGIILCSDKSDSLVKYALPKENCQIYAAKYKLFLPTEEELLNALNIEQYLVFEDKKA